MDEADHDEEMAMDEADHDEAGEGGLPAPVTIKPGETVTVVATFEDGVHVLRPVGIPVEVRRWRDGGFVRAVSGG